MNNERLEAALKECFSVQYTPDENFKAQTVYRMYKRQEHRSSFLLCSIQLAILILTLAIAVSIFIIFRQSILAFFLIGYAITGSIISVVIILLYSKNNANRRATAHG